MYETATNCMQTSSLKTPIMKEMNQFSKPPRMKAATVLVIITTLGAKNERY